MSDLPEALYRGITRGRSPATEGVSVAGMVTDLQRALGTKPPAGISATTWRRLRKDPNRRTMPRTRDALQAAQRRARLGAGREAMLRGTPSIVIAGEIQISSDARYRVLKVSGWPDSPTGPPITGMMGDVLDRWLLVDDQGAANRFLLPLSKSIGSTVHVNDVDYVRFTKGG